MDKLNEYLDSQIKKINKWDKNRTISDYGRGKLKAFEEIKEHLLICAVVQVKPEVCPKGGVHNKIMFTADLDICTKCGEQF